MDLMKALTSQYMKKELPEMNVGDTVREVCLCKITDRADLGSGRSATGMARGSSRPSSIVFSSSGCSLRD